MKDKDIKSLEHTTWRCQYHIVFGSEISPHGDIGGFEAGDRMDIEKAE